MRTVSLLLIYISISCFCYAQETAISLNQSVAKNSIFGEFMSNSVVYGINYDRILVNKEKWKFAVRLGFGYFYDRYNKHHILNFPSEFTFLIGKSKHFFETGPGITYYVFTRSKHENTFNSEVEHYAYLFTRLGYRYQRPQGGFFFKAGLNAGVSLTEYARYTFLYSEFFWVYGGVGIGYTFKQRKNK